MPMPRVVRPIQLTPQGGRLWPTMFHSDTLDLRCNVFVYTPPGVSGRALARLPVLYLLHGMWGSEIDWPFKGDAQRILDREILARRVRPMLVAMPNDGLANNGTFYTNWHNFEERERGRPKLARPLQGDQPAPHSFEDHFVTDLRRFVEIELTGRERPREQRAIAGLSMGGFGSLMLSLRHPELFVTAASMSGAVRPIGDYRYPELGVQIFGPLSDDPASYRRQRDPAILIEDPARGRRVALYLDCGDRDALLTMNRKLHRKLNRLGIEHAYAEYPGAHDWPSWRKRLPHALRFVSGRIVLRPTTPAQAD